MDDVYNPLQDFRIHYKNKPYRVLGKGRHSESLEELVFYKALYPNDTALLWVRPSKMFDESVEHGGRRVPRFRLVRDIREVPHEVYRQISIPDFQNLNYLAAGGLVQRRAFKFFTRTKMMNVLAEFKPILAGTIPLGISVGNSDLDILCEAKDFEYFSDRLFKAFPDWGFESFLHESSDQPPAMVFVCSSQEFPIEIFVQNVPTVEQRAYVHLKAEARLIEMGGEALRREITELKFSGLKTEPAFALTFDLPGDPYIALANLELGLTVD